jgi:hypothetical protein
LGDSLDQANAGLLISHSPSKKSQKSNNSNLFNPPDQNNVLSQIICKNYRQFALKVISNNETRKAINYSGTIKQSLSTLLVIKIDSCFLVGESEK